MPLDEKNARTRLEPRRILAAMGPGMVAALAGADAGGVATYSNAGALFGFMQLWTVPVMCFLLIVAQETAARMGCVTGKGLASLIREQFGVRLSALAMAALLVSNTTVTLSEFAGIASALALFGVPVHVSVPVAALAIWLLTMSGSYRRIEKVLLAIACVFVTYIVAGVMVGPQLGRTPLLHTVVPHVEATPRYLSLLVASVGTAIAPWMLFLAQSNVVEKNAHAEDLPLPARRHRNGRRGGKRHLVKFIILTTGAVLHPAGVEVSGGRGRGRRAGAARGRLRRAALWRGPGRGVAARGVRPAGHHVERDLRGLWLGARRRPQLGRGAGVSRHHHRRHRDLCRGGHAAQREPLWHHDGRPRSSTACWLPVLLVFMVLIASDRHVMGRFANGRLWNALTWFTIVAVTVLTAIMFVMQAMGV